MADSSQKFIARNRAPRVQIEYDVELYGAEKKVQLPFVMGVMSDLAGKSHVAQPGIEDRKFLEIDVDNFDERMRAVAPRAAFSVPNTLTGEGNLPVDLTFESMADFTPGAIAAKVDALRPLLEARQQLETLTAYMDGKAGAEALIEQILANPSLLAAVAEPGSGGAEAEAALESLRGVELPEAEEDGTADVLAGLRAAAPEETAPADTSADILSDLAAKAPGEVSEPDGAADVLAGLAAQVVQEEAPDETADAALASLAGAAVDEVPETDSSADVLADLAAREVADDPAGDTAAAALESLARADAVEAAEEDGSAEILSGLAAEAPADAEEDDSAAAALESLSAVVVDETAEDDSSAGILDDLAALDVEEDAPDEAADAALESLASAAVEETAEDDSSAGILDDLAALDVEEDAPDEAADAALESLASAAVEETAEDDGSAGILDDLAALEVEEDAPDEAADAALESLASAAVDEVAEDDGSAGILDDLAALDVEEDAPDEAADAALESLASAAVEETAEDDSSAGILDDLAALDVEEDAPDEAADAALESLASAAVEETAEDDGSADILDDLAALDVEEDAPDEAADVALESLASAAVEETAEDEAADTALESLVSEAVEKTAEDDGGDDLDALLDGLEDAGTEAAEEEDSGLDDLLDGLGLEDGDAGDGGEPEDAAAVAADDLAADEAPEEADDTDLDDLLAGLGLDEDDDDADAETGGDDLDALLSGLEEEAEEEAAAEEGADELEALLGDNGDSGEELDLDALFADLDSGTEEAAADGSAGAIAADAEPEFAYGTMSAGRPEPQKLERRRLRLAILGDFSGRAAKGMLETGDALAARKAILLDPDTAEDVIEGFATELVLPVGRDGAGIAVKLGGLDDLHPDELYENVELFSELSGLRKQLQSGATAAHAENTLKAWAAKYGTRVRPPKRSSRGNAVPADRRLSDFQQLIGDTAGELRQPSPVEELMARVVGPHIRALPDPDAAAMLAAVDEALSDAMRLVLHHPEFQSVEAQWRSIDLIARSVETDDTLDVMLYDVSAEELAADLAAADDLSESGFVRLLTEEPLDEDNGRGGYSALIGMYQFEETPPHAELLGRFARVAAHVDAPFLAGISPAFLDTAKEDLPGVVAQAWDQLRAMPEAGHLGLLSPRFLLRRPYGEKTEPCYEFNFEEFTMAEGLSGMLWANPAVLAAILLARSFRENGASMQLGSIMTLGGMPYHYVTDRFGDQVALPCTERNIDLDKIAAAQARGFMALSAVKGRDELRLTSFNALSGGGLLGPWTGAPPPEPSPPVVAAAAAAEDAGADDAGSGDADDLDALLASFADDDDEEEDGGDGSGDPDLDDELAALLDDL